MKSWKCCKTFSIGKRDVFLAVAISFTGWWNRTTVSGYNHRYIMSLSIVDKCLEDRLMKGLNLTLFPLMMFAGFTTKLRQDESIWDSY